MYLEPLSPCHPRPLLPMRPRRPLPPPHLVLVAVVVGGGQQLVAVEDGVGARQERQGLGGGGVGWGQGNEASQGCKYARRCTTRYHAHPSGAVANSISDPLAHSLCGLCPSTSPRSPSPNVWAVSTPTPAQALHTATAAPPGLPATGPGGRPTAAPPSWASPRGRWPRSAPGPGPRGRTGPGDGQETGKRGFRTTRAAKLGGPHALGASGCLSCTSAALPGHPQYAMTPGAQCTVHSTNTCTRSRDALQLYSGAAHPSSAPPAASP